MEISGISVVVTGGASGLGRASAHRLVKGGAKVIVADLPTSPGEQTVKEIGARFVPADVTSEQDMTAVFDAAVEQGPLRAVVHCAGRGHPLRIVDRHGNPADLDIYTDVIKTNLIGSFNVLRLAAARMAAAEPVDGERGAIVLTASVAAWEGQIGQIPYASAKAGVVGMTLVAARDLASRQIRVATIAPGIFDTPLLSRVPEEARTALAASVPHPARLGSPDEFAALAEHIIGNPMVNGETIRLDGAIRMAPR